MKNLKRVLFFVVILFSFIVGGISYLLLSHEGSLPAFFPKEKIVAAVHATQLDETIINEIELNNSIVAPTATAEVNVVNVFVSDDLPEGFVNSIIIGDGFVEIDSEANADVTFEIGDSNPVGSWTYALAFPFNSLHKDAVLSDLILFWLNGESNDIFYRPILMTEDTAMAMIAWWGIPAENALEIVLEEELISRAWSMVDQVALIPLDKVSPKWKILYLDGEHPLHNDFDSSNYGLEMPISVNGDDGLSDVDSGGIGFDSNNFSRDEMTNVMLTGVTALVRATAYTMEQQGVLHPGEAVGDFMRSMDVTHISNEVPFAVGCPYPSPIQESLVFCSDSKYYDLLDNVGMDVVELTGDHFNDWGSEAMLYTLDVYNEHGIPYYGGGLNIEDGRKAYTFEDHGNQIAFIGCNGKGLHTATDTYPGAVECDYEFLDTEIERLKNEGYVVIFTSQHNEIYQFAPSYELMRDFRFANEAGADIVSGSQAHVPHGVELFDDAIITYGLGNMFFDQYTTYEWGGEAVLAVHTIYQNEYVHTELVPILFVDYAKPVFASENEGQILLEMMFKVSFWR